MKKFLKIECNKLYFIFSLVVVIESPAILVKPEMNPLTVVAVNFYPLLNSKENYTEKFELVKNGRQPTPVLRRGQDFNCLLQFDRPFVQGQDVVKIHLSIGAKPNVTKGTKVVLPVRPKQKELDEGNAWSLAVQQHNNNDVHVRIHIPHSAQVGIWKCAVYSNIHGDQKTRNISEREEDIYILFNPWCKDDLVYMSNEQDRKEYVLNDTGKIWIGTFKEPKGKRWVYGQYDDCVLPACMFLLEKSDLAHSDRGSPILVARAISAVINSEDDEGLLAGRWDGEYGDGTSPFAWTGSVAIFEQFLKGGGSSVKYGQCWVFSAATVTICRALGIPCRSVTNYVSAHDTNRSLTVDKYFDIFGELIENGPEGDCNDSCWNFHVWNDVWMERPDLPEGYGGWQIIDGTPQELSGDTYCCGPASIVAVKNGEVGYLYDTPFVFSEVNADICHFQEDEDSDWGFSRMSINRYQVGRKVLTKRPDISDEVGDSDMWDVTLIYKHPEGSQAEQLAVAKAIKGVPKAAEQYRIPPKTKEDVDFDLVDIDTVQIGKSFNVIVNVINKSSEVRNITTTLSASSVFYMGATAHRIKKARGTFSVQPGKKEVLSIHVEPEDYLDKLVEHSLIKLYAIANVKETKQTWCEEDDFVLSKPELNIQTRKAQVGHQTPVYFSFTNPFKTGLTQCVYTIEANGLQKPKTMKHRDIKPNETINFREIYVPQAPGKLVIVATFNSAELSGITGSAAVEVN